jgi:hypothetical protein
MKISDRRCLPGGGDRRFFALRKATDGEIAKFVRLLNGAHTEKGGKLHNLGGSVVLERHFFNCLLTDFFQKINIMIYKGDSFDGYVKNHPSFLFVFYENSKIEQFGI